MIGLTDYTGRRAVYTPHALAIVDAGKQPALRLTWADLDDRANRLAHHFRKCGIAPGSRVAILARDGVEHLDCFFACSKLGAIHTALNWRLHAEETAAILERTTPGVLLFSAEFAPVIATLRADPRAACVQHWIALDDPAAPFEHLLESADPAPVPSPVSDPETIAALIFTGGTTGLPKAARISHRQIAWNSLNTIIHDLRHGDIYLNVFPLFHTGGLFVYTLPNVILGGTTILTRQFDPDQVLALIAQERVTLFAGVPTMYQMLTQAAGWESADLSSLRFCTSGGAPLPVPLVAQYDREKGVRFKQGFGMTEFGPGLFALAADDAISHAGTVGRPNFFVEARIVDDDNQPVPPGTVGELVLKGPSASSGYYGESASPLDDDGWFHTGDLAICDADHYFRIVDRKKDMFISGGENVYPAEIEAVLYQHPAVLQCAVIGVPDPKWGEVGLACVVLRPGLSAEPSDLLAHMSARLARYKCPRRVAILPALPVSAAGKILKRDLRTTQ
jgi:fatty-acyl-CoA synthase